MLRGWIGQKEKIKDTTYKTRRRVERTRVSPFPALGTEFYQWIMERWNAAQIVDGHAIRQRDSAKKYPKLQVLDWLVLAIP